MRARMENVMFWSNLITGVAYYAITIQLFIFINNPKVLRLFRDASNCKDSKKRRVFLMIVAIVTLFASYIWLCGNTHLINVLRLAYPHNVSLVLTEEVIMTVCASISILTALTCVPLFPALVETVQQFELGSDGKIQHTESYLIEAVDLVKESILVVSDNMIVQRANNVSKITFGSHVVGSSFPTFLHPEDVLLFDDAVVRVANSYNFTPATIEVRVHVLVTSPRKPNPTPRSQYTNRPTVRAVYDNRVYATDGPGAAGSTTPSYRKLPTPYGLSHQTPANGPEYKWIEITMCRGKQFAEEGGFEYDLKMVCRDIDDHKKNQANQLLVDSVEEKNRANEGKMRYISCIAHDLKTPVQSFSFSLDLLAHTELSLEQREFVQQANVAVDLMKLTISQTMDISKALTGAKLMPRRTTVFLTSVLNRVKIIINGYGKQVPVSFEVAPDVCDEIITDEEWLWQMLLNLLTNACKYTDRGSIQVRISVTAERTLPTSAAVIPNTKGLTPLRMTNPICAMLLCEVIDTGVGINEAKIGHIFDAFAQVQEGQVTGTGLGLFGVRTRAEGLLGTCGARHNTESSTGTGTVLWFSIPFVPDTSVQSGESANSPMNPAPSSPTPTDDFAITPKPTIFYLQRNRTASTDLAINTEVAIRRLRLTAMVVEDTATVRKLMERLLLKMGFERVDCYENGSKGLEAMMAAPVDIVFSDVQMPIMTGPEMVSRFRKWEADALRAAVQSNRSPACASTSTDNNSVIHAHPSISGSVPPSPLNRAAGIHAVTNLSQHGVAVLTVPSPLHRGGNPPPLSLINPSGLGAVFNIPSIITTHMLYGHSSNPQTARYMRTVRPRQLIVAVTANGAECGECGENGFDEICLKPLGKHEIYQIINRYFPSLSL